MKNAKIFENGKSQAVRLPKEYRFQEGEDEVAVNMVGGVVMLVSKKNPWGGFLESLDMFSDDFMKDGRTGNKVQERSAL